MHAASLVGQVVLGEHRLEELVRDDGALATFAATSTVDGGRYTVVVAPNVAVETAATAVETAASRAARHAVGLRGLLPILSARPLPMDEVPHLAVVRRGEPMRALASVRDERPRSAAEVARLLEPIAVALTALHDQGVVHGAVTTGTIVMRDDVATLDLFGISAAAEAASGARGARDVVPVALRAPELGAAPMSPGPWTDAYALARVALELLAGAAVPAGTPRSLGLEVPDRVEELFRLALAESPSPRPGVARFQKDLAAFALDAPPARASGAAARGSGPQLEPPRPSGPVGAAASDVRRDPQAPPLAPTPLGPAPPPPPPSPPPPSVREPGSAVLAWSIAGILAFFALVMAGSLAYVLTQGPPAAGSASTSPPAPPPPIATATASTAPSTSGTARAPDALDGLGTVRTGTVPTYPADAEALIPVHADAAVRGDRDALVTLVVFGDLTCPFTAKTLASIPGLEAKFGPDLRVVLAAFPLPSHPDAAAASEASLAVLRVGGPAAFWKLVASVAQNGRADAGRLEELGIRAGVPAGTVTDALAKHPDRARLERDVDLGRRLGVRGTPTLFFNGRRLDGHHAPEVLAAFVEHELRRAREVKSSVPRDRLYQSRVLANVTTSEGERPVR